MALHSDIFSYSPAHVPSDMGLTELAPHVYGIKLFTPEFCRKLLEEAEACGKWESEEKIDSYGPRIHPGPHECYPTTAKPLACRINEKEDDTSNDAEPDTKCGLSFASLPGLYGVFSEIIDRHVVPKAREFWPTYKMKRKRTPYILRYIANDYLIPKDMEVHWDQSAIATVVYLNDEFSGGGTYFPRWDLEAGKNGPGWAVFYPGGVGYQHGAQTILSGRRYVLVCDFY